MSIRQKTIVILFFAFLGLTIAAATIMRLGVTHDFDRLERTLFDDTVRRVLGLIEAEKERLGVLTADNAAWDDVWAWQRGERPEARDALLTPKGLAAIGVDAVSFHALSGEVTEGAALDRNANFLVPLPETLRVAGAELARPLAASSRPWRASLRLLDDAPWLAAAARILRTDGSGPTAGVLIFFRRLDETDLDRLSRLARLPLTFVSAREGAPPPLPSEADDIAIQALSEDELAAWVRLPDDDGRADLALRIRAPRSVALQGRKAAGQFLGWMSLSALGLSGLALLLTDRLALRRLSRLSAQAARIAGSGTPAFRLGPQGEDEIGQLAASLDAMLAALEQAEGERRRAEDVYRAVVQDHTELICRTRPGGELLFVNEAICRFLGLAREELSGKRFLDFLAPAERRRVEAALATLSPAIPTCVVEHPIRDGEGRERWLKTTIRVFFDDQGRQTGRQAVGTDVTDLKLAEAELRQANEELERRVTERAGELALANDRLRRQAEELRQGRLAAERAAQAKGEFLATMSHEIRTPMSGVLGMLDLALGQNPPPEIRDCLRLARTSAEALLVIVNDVLDFSKIESGRLPLIDKPFHLPDLLNSVAATLGVTANAKGLRLSVDVDQGTPLWLKGDEGRLRQVLMNVAGNAVKYTEQGSVEVRVAVCPETPPPPEGTILLFTVRDTGVGIPPDKLELIFESFSQLGESSRAEAGGTGLGLAISRRLAALMGGSVTVASQVGRGSDFFIRLPLALAQPQESQTTDVPPPPDRPPAPLRLLVVEDNLISRTLVQGLLERRGHAVEVAANGREALEKLAAARFDAVFMDAHMPVMSGEETARLIRHAPPPGVDARLPIIALTAHALPEDRERFLAAGMDAYVAKPIDPLELDRALRQVTTRRP